jgi:phage FluMu protein Com
MKKEIKCKKCGKLLATEEKGTLTILQPYVNYCKSYIDEKDVAESCMDCYHKGYKVRGHKETVFVGGCCPV